MANYYDYQDLERKALLPCAAQEDIDALGEWFEQFGSRYWNGECYDIDGNRALFPVYREVSEDEYEIIGWEIR